METKFKDRAQIFKAFCDENRLKILEMLQTGEKCACVLLEKLQVTQPTLSHHMKTLCDSGVVTPRKVGKWTYYSINEQAAEEAVALLRQMLSVTENAGVEDTGCCE